ncbi:MAG: phosphoadenosine phosphosulfate reductase [Rhodobacteraceae bacterium CG17_big_fil_post_rev_8_21_14_2_50_65_11]|nr:MAG: phosphoadenosine phosphosulfate reductase [Rhodobacteraceae bacterium CG17_big_fil_post_rev_8_21_14_2_50_65_11]
MNDMQMPDAQPRPSRADLFARLGQIGDMHGFFAPVGARHHALYVQEGDTLLVTFDEVGHVLKHGRDTLPAGFDAVSKREWSLLSLVADGATWFRDDALFRFFDRLIDEDFFDSFDQVIFFGAGPMCGYGAAAFSAAAPGAKVFALSPAATLNREDAPFELRFRRAWRKDFSHRYANAADMIGAASAAFIVYDPGELLDAGHVAMFRGPKVTRLRFRGGGRDIGHLLEASGSLDRCLKAVSNGRMSRLRFAQIIRRLRQTNPDYLKRLLARALERGGTTLPLVVAREGLSATGDAHFARAMMTLEAEAGQGDRA